MSNHITHLLNSEMTSKKTTIHSSGFKAGAIIYQSLEISKWLRTELCCKNFEQNILNKTIGDLKNESTNVENSAESCFNRVIILTYLFIKFHIPLMYENEQSNNELSKVKIRRAKDK